MVGQVVQGPGSLLVFLRVKHEEGEATVDPDNSHTASIMTVRLPIHWQQQSRGKYKRSQHIVLSAYQQALFSLVNGHVFLYVIRRAALTEGENH